MILNLKLVLTEDTLSVAETQKTILLIEDEHLIAEYEAQTLEKYGYAVIQAHSGEKAVELITNGTPVDIILSDINLGKGIDGIEAVKQILAKRQTPVIFLSSHGEGDIVESTAQVTSYGYLIKDSNDFIMLQTIKKALQLFEAENKLKILAARLQRDQEVAREQLFNLNTKSLPTTPELNIATYYGPSNLLGGDISIVIKDEATNTLLTILADCTGHGVHSAMEATQLKVILDRYVRELFVSQDPAQFLSNISSDLARYILETHSEGHYPTMLVTLTDLNTKVITYANANGELPWIIGPAQVVKKLPKVYGFHIGYVDERVKYINNTYVLQPGETLIAFSDAFKELKLSSDKILGDDGVTEVLKNLSAQGSARIPELVQIAEKLHQGQLEDDLTITMLEYAAPREQQLVIHAEKELAQVKEKIKSMLDQYGYSRVDIGKNDVALNEMILNALTHGNHNDPQKKVAIDLKVDFEEATFTVTDEGAGFDPSKVPDPTDPARIAFLMATCDPDDEDSLLSHGRGVYMTKKMLANEMTYNAQGNSVTFSIKRTPPETIFSDTAHPRPITVATKLISSADSLTIPTGHFLNSVDITFIINQARKYKAETGQPLAVIIQDNLFAKEALVKLGLVDLGLVTTL